MRRPSWRLGALITATALLGAACSTSPSAVKHTPTTKATVAHPVTAPKKNAKKPTYVAGTYSNGSSVTGNTGSAITLPGGGTIPGVGTTTIAGATTTTTGSGTTTTGVTSTRTPQFVVTKTGRIRHRHTSPVIAKFRPPSSPVGGTVTIVGKRLSHATAVTFDGLQGTITSNSSTRIRAVVPAGATSGPISVVTSDGSATTRGFVVN